ncbi:hypothetical protein CCMSSC00406_0010031 [Pleurotus cornucopiae]|uniref:Uncharacterized protein n=1 Tax=Pleurotus cornucopiae TaxID=5321 RepID=A0ACB7IJQ7_PLECO|nr:hypothetical protein CCMSSC00406_0010031 [Pleurotus cornucopiae]
MTNSDIKLTIGALQVAVSTSASMLTFFGGRKLMYMGARIGIAITGYLLGCSAVQTYVYFKNYPGDQQRIQSLVMLLMLIETAQQICLTHAVFVLSIQNWGNDNALLHIPKSLTATLVLTACDALLVEWFYFWRIYKLIARRWPSMIGAALSVVRFAGWMFFTSQSTHIGFASQKLVEEWKWLIVTLLVGLFVNNGFISGTILGMFLRSRPGAMSRTKLLLDQLITWTIETCLITELIYVAVIVLFVTLRESFVWLVVLACGIKVSSNCLLSSYASVLLLSCARLTVRLIYSVLLCFLKRSLNNRQPTQPPTEPTFGASINHDFPLIITVNTANETRRDHDTASEFTTAPNSVLAQEIK